MQWRNDAHRYGWVTILIHWLMAMGVFGLLAVGYYMVDLSYYDPLYHQLPAWHKAAGVLMGVLLVARVSWHLLAGLPGPLPTTPAWERRLAWVTHKAIYVLLFGAVTSGYLMSTAKGAPIDVFGFVSVPAVPALLERQEDVAGWWHEVFVYSLAGLLVLHIAGAVKHAVLDRDATLRRMLGMAERDT